MKIVHTGDLHIGRKYSTYATDIANQYYEARFNTLRNIVKLQCDFIVIAGDLFDSKSVLDKEVKEVTNILGTADSTVIVVPGNHDYCIEQDKFWNKFNSYAASNTVVLTNNITINDVVFHAYPCTDKYSETNALHQTELDTNKFNIGIAHGSIGISYDKEQRYYKMTEKELLAMNMDLWLIGHTHIPYHNNIIFNAGTPQQTDISDNSDNGVFLIDIDKHHIDYTRIQVGEITFKRLELKIDFNLEESIKNIVEPFNSNSSLRIVLSGIVDENEYQNKEIIYNKYNNFIYMEVFDDDLKRSINAEMINTLTIPNSVENKLLWMYKDEPDILNLAYDLIKEAKNANKIVSH